MSYFLQSTYGQHNDKVLNCFFELFLFKREVLVLGFINHEKAYKIILNQNFSFKHFECYVIKGPLGNYAYHQQFSQQHIDFIKKEKKIDFSILTDEIKKDFCLNSTHYPILHSLNYHFDFKDERSGVISHDFVYHGRKNMDMCQTSLIKKNNIAYLVISSNKLDRRYLKFKLHYEHNNIFVKQLELYENIFSTTDLNQIIPLFDYVLQRKLNKNESLPEFDEILMSYFCIDSFD